MKRRLVMSCLFCGLLASMPFVSADEPNKAVKERPDAANREPGLGRGEGKRPGEARPGEGRPGEGRPGEGRPGEGRPGGMMRPGMGDVSQIVSRMMREFDKDGDQKLDASELTALLGFMRERQGMMGGPGGFMPGGQRPGGFEGRPGIMERGRGAEENNEAGGVKPRRPPAE